MINSLQFERSSRNAHSPTQFEALVGLVKFVFVQSLPLARAVLLKAGFDFKRDFAAFCLGPQPNLPPPSFRLAASTEVTFMAEPLPSSPLLSGCFVK